MPVDFQNYILSSSPPGFELDLYSSEHFFKQNGFNKQNGFIGSIQSSNPTAKTRAFAFFDEQPCSVLGNAQKDSSDSTRNAERILSWKHSYENFTSNGKPALSTKRCQSEAKICKKKVSFADDVGLALEDVRILTESSDVPPTLSTELLARLNLGSSSPSVEPLSVIFNFSQPGSDYLNLRNKVENDKVSLENVTVKGRSMMGTVRVKNVAFEKKVFVRFTNNNWLTYEDFPATYVPVTGSSPLTPQPYDTFAFEVSLPSSIIEAENMHFAVCFQAGAEQFWDSNNGENYEVISVAQEMGHYTPSHMDKMVFSLHHEDSWTAFSGWDGFETADPYW